MKLENLKMKEVQKLANEAVNAVVKTRSNNIVKDMIKMGIVRKEYKCNFSFNGSDPVAKKIKSADVKFFVYNVDFIPNDEYECEEGFAAYGARGNFSSGLVVGPMSFVLIWNEKESKFLLEEMVFDNHPFSFTDKRIIIK